VRHDRFSLYIFNSEKRLSAIGDSGVVKAGNARVGQLGKIPLAREPVHHGPAVQGDDRQLERNRPLEFAIRAFRQPDHSHAALSQFADQTVGSDGLTRGEPCRKRCGGRLRAGSPFDPGKRVEKVAAFQPLFRQDELPQGRQKRRLFRSQAVHPGLAGIRGKVEPLVEQPGEHRP